MTSEMLLREAGELRDCICRERRTLHQNPETGFDLSATLSFVKNELLDSTLRFSFSVNTTKEEIDYALAQVNEVLPALRKFVRK